VESEGKAFSNREVEVDGDRCAYDRAASLYVPTDLRSGLRRIRGPKGLEHDLRIPEVLIFALSGDGNRGRLVRRPGPGYYLVVAHSQATLPPGPGISCIQEVHIEPATFELRGWEVHIEEGAKLELTDRSFSIRVDPKKLDLKPDPVAFRPGRNGSKGTPVFAGEPPTVVFDQATKCIIVGEEGPRRRGWRPRLDVSSTFEDDFRRTLSSHGRGWYFIRSYNEEEVLLQSLDFWYEPELTNVSLIQSGSADIVVIECTGQIQICQAELVSAAPSGNSGGLVPSLSSTKTETRVEVPRTLTARAVDLQIVPGASESYELRVPLHRHWWSLGPEDQIPGKWSLDPIDVPLGCFKATSNQGLWLLFSDQSYASRVELSYGDTVYRPPHVADSTMWIPLRELEHAVGESSNGDVTLKLDTRVGMDVRVVLRVLSRFKCRYCSLTSNSTNDAAEHAIESHLDEIMPKTEDYSLLVSAYHKQFPGKAKLPVKIYQCLFCSYVTPEYTWMDRAPDRMNDHAKECPGQLDDYGPPQTRFKIITNVEDIRASQLAFVFNEIGMGRQCLLCSEIFLKCETSIDVVVHLKGRHGNELYEPE
jgi:hypothetical protein